MKIFIPSEGPDRHDRVGAAFGRSEYHIIYNSDDDSYTSYYNHFKDTNEPVGINIAKLIINLDIKVVISVSIGGNALSVLKESEISIFLAKENSTVEEAVEEFYRKGLDIYNLKEPGFDYHIKHKN